MKIAAAAYSCNAQHSSQLLLGMGSTLFPNHSLSLKGCLRICLTALGIHTATKDLGESNHKVG